jgi:hypothetical protein
MFSSIRSGRLYVTKSETPSTRKKFRPPDFKMGRDAEESIAQEERTVELKQRSKSWNSKI